MVTRAQQIIQALGLVPHPERGHYVESYRAGGEVRSASHAGPRQASTAIYFLISADEPSTRLHRLLSDEIFHLYEGGPLEVLCLAHGEPARVHRLGLDFASGERPQLVIPAGTWFGAELASASTHCLIGCTVAPGFEFEDFELAHGAELERQFPEASARIQRMLGAAD